MTKELWQAYRENGEPDSSRGLTKEASRTGALHGAVHIWVWRRLDEGIEVLLQRRSRTMRTWPGYLDVSAAGHIDFSETPLQAALRETREELGVADIQDDMLELGFVYRMSAKHIPDTNIIENEFQWVYLFEYDVTHPDIAADGVEVEEVHWVTIPKLVDLANRGEADWALVPYNTEYFAMVLSSLSRISP